MCVDMAVVAGNANVKDEEVEQSACGQRMDLTRLVRGILVFWSLFISLTSCDCLRSSYKCILIGACAKRLEDISYFGIDPHLSEKLPRWRANS